MVRLKYLQAGFASSSMVSQLRPNLLMLLFETTQLHQCKNQLGIAISKSSVRSKSSYIDSILMALK